ncbi:hypothetical protein M9Y10_004811 [Tritrichomonas musculus]|uniref:Uncharacterized protein n=1 Tax=Tritrichomonas musculus TaxID=1915356 RepID=A0ABR2JKW1_9EUKA
MFIAALLKEISNKLYNFLLFKRLVIVTFIHEHHQLQTQFIHFGLMSRSTFPLASLQLSELIIQLGMCMVPPWYLLNG